MNASPYACDELLEGICGDDPPLLEYHHGSLERLDLLQIVRGVQDGRSPFGQVFYNPEERRPGFDVPPVVDSSRRIRGGSLRSAMAVWSRRF